MHTYETVFAVPASITIEEREGSIKSVEELITSLNGSVTTSEEIGEKEMAYKVKGNDRAYYHLIKFDCPPEKVNELSRHYRIHNNYIRNLIIVEDK
ncbi:30S ribosomal protein S6 [Elusimicrobiota bacterium]